MTTTATPPTIRPGGRLAGDVTARPPRGRGRGLLRTRYVALVLAVATVVAYLLFRVPEAATADDAAAFRFFNHLRDWVDTNRDTSPVFLYGFNYLRLGVRLLVDAVQSGLYGLGFAGLVAAVTAIALVLAGWRTSLLALAGFLAFAVLGLWQESVDTLVLTLSAVLLSILIGVPLGVLAARVRWVGAALRPVLDVMQILPSFAYLAPMTLLFLIGEPAAVIATLIYAVPATIRITALGIGEVSPATVEAATAFGSTRWQLLAKVRLPMARPTIVLAVNQTIMMALSMVVVTALIDAPGLGQNIIRALERVDVGAAVDAGVAIVIMAVVLDRITTRAARARRPAPSHARPAPAPTHATSAATVGASTDAVPAGAGGGSAVTEGVPAGAGGGSAVTDAVPAGAGGASAATDGVPAGAGGARAATDAVPAGAGRAPAAMGGVPAGAGRASAGTDAVPAGAGGASAAMGGVPAGAGGARAATDAVPAGAGGGSAVTGGVPAGGGGAWAAAAAAAAPAATRATPAGAWASARGLVVRWVGSRWISAGAALVAVVVVALLPITDGLPRLSFAGPVNDATGWIELHWYDATEWIKNTVSADLIDPLQNVLVTTPWWLFVLAVAVFGTLVSGWRAAAVAAPAAAGVAGLGLWQHAMQTLATVLVAIVLTMIIGVWLGVVCARHDRLAATLRPLLDAAQTMPSFVYLLPAVALFGNSRFTAIVAAVIYAVAPVVRLVERGLRDVPPTVVEAATSAGSTPRQLLWKVQLPMARGGLLLAANQGIVMVLAMVVVGGLVGAGALGYDVVAGFSQREDFGKGLAAGFAIVLLGILLDRLTQGFHNVKGPRS